MSTSLKSAVQRTLAYARFFDFDLTLVELHYWLISPQTVSFRHLTSMIHDLRSTLSPKRLRRQRASQRKLFLATRLAGILRLVPTINFVAVTGSLAVGNAKRTDDIDLLIITSPNTLWLTRLLVIPLLRLFFPTRHPASAKSMIYDLRSKISDAICP